MVDSPGSGRSPSDRRAANVRGALAEGQVAAWLESRGWVIVARNWRGAGGELDLVACSDARLRIVEVKARGPNDPVGIEAVDGRKQRKLIRAAEAFLARYNEDVDEVCFSVALVEGDEITWIDDAFDA